MNPTLYCALSAALLIAGCAGKPDGTYLAIPEDRNTRIETILSMHHDAGVKELLEVKEVGSAAVNYTFIPSQSFSSEDFQIQFKDWNDETQYARLGIKETRRGLVSYRSLKIADSEEGTFPTLEEIEAENLKK